MKQKDVVKMSPTEYLILKMLISNKCGMYGLEILKHSDSKLKRGTIYTTLSRMEDKGFISSKKEEKIQKGLTAKRRIYKPTGLGERSAIYFHNQTTELLGGCFA